MSLLDTLRKGFGYVLLSMGVSRPAPKPKSPPKTNPETNPESTTNPDPKSSTSG